MVLFFKPASDYDSAFILWEHNGFYQYGGPEAGRESAGPYAGQPSPNEGTAAQLQKQPC